MKVASAVQVSRVEMFINRGVGVIMLPRLKASLKRLNRVPSKHVFNLLPLYPPFLLIPFARLSYSLCYSLVYLMKPILMSESGL